MLVTTEWMRVMLKYKELTPLKLEKYRLYECIAQDHPIVRELPTNILPHYHDKIYKTIKTNAYEIYPIMRIQDKVVYEGYNQISTTTFIAPNMTLPHGIYLCNLWETIDKLENVNCSLCCMNQYYIRLEDIIIPGVFEQLDHTNILTEIKPRKEPTSQERKQGLTLLILTEKLKYDKPIENAYKCTKCNIVHDTPNCPICGITDTVKSIIHVYSNDKLQYLFPRVLVNPDHLATRAHYFYIQGDHYYYIDYFPNILFNDSNS
jgi:hypothetical protein